MNIEEILGQLKKIEPRAAYTETSRRALLAMEPVARQPWTARRTLLHILESGVAVALAGFFVILLTGGLSGSQLAPQYSAIDPQSLHAEAEAIDIQIQLANLKYSEVSSAESTVSAAAVAASKPATVKVGMPKVAVTTSPTANGSATTSATSTSVSIDEALQGLTQ